MGPPAAERLCSVTFGCVPTSVAAGVRTHLNDLCAALTELLDIEVRPHRAPNPGALAAAFRAERVHLAWMSPTLALTDERVRDASVLVSSVRGGSASYHAVFYASAAGPIHTLDDIEDSRVAWVASTSASGYIFPRIALRAAGHDPTGLFREERFYGTHAAATAAVLGGEADVAGTFAVFEGGDPDRPLRRAGFLEDGGEPSSVRVLCASDAIPSDVIVASPAFMRSVEVDPVIALIRVTDTEMGAAAVAALMGADGFAPCNQVELRKLQRHLIRAVEDGIVEVG